MYILLFYLFYSFSTRKLNIFYISYKTFYINFTEIITSNLVKNIFLSPLINLQKYSIIRYIALKFIKGRFYYEKMVNRES